ncbi:MAG: hypothetical protein DMD82_14305 [Candidatus Rokuibacteriota bacterium]|nr:MAG: hypothetical protein DMD82_14305 [Candidatus Rokubacteria bacterium]
MIGVEKRGRRDRRAEGLGGFPPEGSTRYPGRRHALETSSDARQHPPSGPLPYTDLEARRNMIRARTLEA